MSLQLPLPWAGNGGIRPTFEQTIRALGSIPAILYRALEFGTGQNRAFFETLSEKEPPRSHIREMIVRDQAKRFLQRNHFHVDDESVSIGNEPLAALILRCGPIQIRVLKGFEGQIPGCGDSMRRRHFYNQTPATYRDGNDSISRTRLNLILLWDFDKAFNLANLWLACPIRAGQTTADVLVLWHEMIPHPAVTIPLEAFPQVQAEAEDELEKLLREEEPEDEEGSEQA